MSDPGGENPRETRATDIDGVEDPFVASLGSTRASESESPPWLQDIDGFQSSHHAAIEKICAALSNPSEQALEAANEAIIVARKNSDLLFEKGFFWDHSTTDSGQENAALPLISTVAALARAVEDLDRQLKQIFPLKIARDNYSVDDLEAIVKAVREAADEKEGLEPVGKLCRQYSVISAELQDALKAPRITRAAKSADKDASTTQIKSEWKKQALDLGLAGAVLVGATVLGQYLSRPKK